MPAANVDLYPEFEVNKYTLIFDATQGGRFESNDARTISYVYEYGATPEVLTEVPVFPGKVFADWSEDIPATVTKDITFTALYDSVEYTVKFVDGNETLEEFPAYYDDKIHEEDVPEGYSAENSWYVLNEDGTKTVVNFPYEVKGDTVLYAEDTANVFNADFYVDGELYKSVPTIYNEEIVAPEAPAKEGYTFKMWNPEVGIMDEEGKSFSAVYEINTTTITALSISPR